MSEFDKPVSQWGPAAGAAPVPFERTPGFAVAPWHKLVFLLFLMAAAVNLAFVVLKMDATWTGRWPEGLLVTFAAATTLLGLGRVLPWQNVLMAAAIILGASGGILLVGGVSGVPFGPIFYTEALGGTLFSTVPWPLPLLWVAIIIEGRGVARLIMGPWRETKYYGFWLIGLASLLAVILDLGLEPMAVHVKGYWLWRTPQSMLNWYNAPWINFLGWFTVALVILVLVIPWLINKKPVKQTVDYHPLITWWVLNLWLIVGNAMHHLWPAVALSLAANLVMTALAVRGGARANDRSKRGNRVPRF